MLLNKSELIFLFFLIILYSFSIISFVSLQLNIYLKSNKYAIKRSKVIKNDTIVAFDLDGTILNSADDLIFSLNVLLSELGQQNVSTNQVNMLVGNGALAMIKKAYEINNVKSNNIDYEKLKQRFLDIYKTCYVKKSRLYPFTYEILEFLKEKQIKMLLVSNKPEYFVKNIRSF